MLATLRWPDWFNNHCLFGPIGYIPPAEAEANCYAALEILDRAARLKANSLRKTGRGSLSPEQKLWVIESRRRLRMIQSDGDGVGQLLRLPVPWKHRMRP